MARPSWPPAAGAAGAATRPTPHRPTRRLANHSPVVPARKRSSSWSSSSSPTSAWSAFPTPGNRPSSRTSRRPGRSSPTTPSRPSPRTSASSTSASTARSWSPTFPGSSKGPTWARGWASDFCATSRGPSSSSTSSTSRRIRAGTRVEDFRVIMKELEAFSPEVAARPQILAANKVDLLGADKSRLVRLRRMASRKKIPLFAISALKKEGLKPLVEAVARTLDELAGDGRAPGRSAGRLMETIGLFGGTFDPIHLGHLRAAAEVRRLARLDRILFIPSYIPPHKAGGGAAPAADRLRMVELACRRRAGFEVSPIEVEARGKSYSIRTLRKIRALSPAARLFFIVGIDAFLDIGTWHEYEKVLAECLFIVTGRPGFELERAAGRSRRAPPRRDRTAGRGREPGRCRPAPLPHHPRPHPGPGRVLDGRPGPGPSRRIPRGARAPRGGRLYPGTSTLSRSLEAMPEEKKKRFTKRSLPAEVRLAVEAALGRKAEDLCVLDLRELASFTDFFLDRPRELVPAERRRRRGDRSGAQAGRPPAAQRRGPRVGRLGPARLRLVRRPHLFPGRPGPLRPRKTLGRRAPPRLLNRPGPPAGGIGAQGLTSRYRIVIVLGRFRRCA